MRNYFIILAKSLSVYFLNLLLVSDLWLIGCDFFYLNPKLINVHLNYHCTKILKYWSVLSVRTESKLLKVEQAIFLTSLTTLCTVYAYIVADKQSS